MIAITVLVTLFHRGEVVENKKGQLFLGWENVKPKKAKAKAFFIYEEITILFLL